MDGFEHQSRLPAIEGHFSVQQVVGREIAHRVQAEETAMVDRSKKYGFEKCGTVAIISPPDTSTRSISSIKREIRDMLEKVRGATAADRSVGKRRQRFEDVPDQIDAGKSSTSTPTAPESCLLAAAQLDHDRLFRETRLRTPLLSRIDMGDLLLAGNKSRV